MSTQEKPLTGVRIVAFTGFLLGPAACQYLADLGATVVKVEEPTKGPFERNWAGAESFVNGVSTLFMLAHRNVKSVGIDLKNPMGQAAARRIVATADVVVANFRPGVLDRVGLGTEALLEEFPALIYATASGYGARSSVASQPGQDLLLQARTGLAAMTGRRDGPPVAAGAAVIDQHGASLLAMGVLAALLRRTRTGIGGHVEVTMFQAALDLQLEPFTYYINGAHFTRPAESIASGFHPGPYGFYEVSDGYIALSLSPVAQIAVVLGSPPDLDPFHDPDVAFERRDEIHRAIQALVLERSTDELLGDLLDAGIWCTKVNDYHGLLEDDLFAEIDPVERIDHPEAGEVRLLKPPFRFDGAELPMDNPPPSLGEHTDQVLYEAGLIESEIDDLRRQGAIR